MRLALTHAYSWPAVRRGGERYLHELARALQRRGHDVTILTAGPDPGRTDDAGVTIIRHRQRSGAGRAHEREFGWRIIPTLRRDHFDAVHALGLYDARAALRARSLGAAHRVVYTNLGIPLRDGPFAQPLRLHQRVMNGVDAYGCLSRYALDVLRDQFGATGVLTPGGVDLNRFAIGRRDARPTILFSGDISEPRKGVAELLAAMEHVLAAEPNAQLWLSGPGSPTPDAAAAQLLAGASEAVRAATTALPIGHPDDQAGRYGAAWVTAVPARSEAFGLIVLESLACGTPVVANTDAGLPELVRDGVTGALAPASDAVAFAAAISNGLRLAGTAPTPAACRDSVAAYDWDRLATDYEALYRSG